MLPNGGIYNKLRIILITTHIKALSVTRRCFFIAFRRFNARLFTKTKPNAQIRILKFGMEFEKFAP